jgi:twitching motility protein PilU
MEHALAFAETGHLCLSTLHANNANQALDRVINFFPEERRNQLLLDMSLNLRAFVSQRLIPAKNGKRVAAIEVLLGTPLVTELIRKGDIHLIKEVMEKSEELGMQTFDADLYHLFKDDKITLEEALRNADSPNNLKLRISLSEPPPTETKQPVHPRLQGASAVDTSGLSLTPIQKEEDKPEEKGPLLPEIKPRTPNNNAAPHPLPPGLKPR